jgi:hypothetical protein
MEDACRRVSPLTRAVPLAIAPTIRCISAFALACSRSRFSRCSFCSVTFFAIRFHVLLNQIGLIQLHDAEHRSLAARSSRHNTSPRYRSSLPLCVRCTDTWAASIRANMVIPPLRHPHFSNPDKTRLERVACFAGRLLPTRCASSPFESVCRHQGGVVLACHRARRE